MLSENGDRYVALGLYLEAVLEQSVGDETDLESGRVLHVARTTELARGTGFCTEDFDWRLRIFSVFAL